MTGLTDSDGKRTTGYCSDREQCVSAETSCAGISGVRLAGPGGIDQVKESLDRFPQFVLRVATVAAVLAPPARMERISSVEWRARNW